MSEAERGRKLKGILYGVGVGPGDPELMTVKAVKTLQKVQWIAVPDTGGDKSALSIAVPYIEGKPRIFCPTPMTRDRETLQKAHEEGVRLITEKLDMGEDVAFITLGDPSVYSTYMYLHRLVGEAGYEARMIPGVPSFCAAAAALNISLCDGGEPLHILPASYEGTEELLHLNLKGSKVLMKSGRSLAEVKEKLREMGFDRVQMAECCSMKNERLYHSLDEIPDQSSYFSILIVK